jgi:hypothetical protein
VITCNAVTFSSNIADLFQQVDVKSGKVGEKKDKNSKEKSPIPPCLQRVLQIQKFLLFLSAS